MVLTVTDSQAWGRGNAVKQWESPRLFPQGASMVLLSYG